jgi:hypothetical protein
MNYNKATERLDPVYTLKNYKYHAYRLQSGYQKIYMLLITRSYYEI